MNIPASFYKSLSVFVTLIILFYLLTTISSGCAQIGSISGGDKDTLAPVLLKASPPQNTVNFKGNQIQFTFDEYIDVKDVGTNVIVSPYQNTNPIITFNRKTINIKFRDTLLPNTTYSINFGNSIRDFNEANPLSGLTYVFSTGSEIDELSISGKVLFAETSKADSTIEVLVYKDATDSSVHTRKPDYLVRTNGAGEFELKNLPAASYKVYALRDNDGNKRYNSNKEVFGFLNNDIFPENFVAPFTIYAYREVPLEETKPSLPKIDKVFKISSNLENKKADILNPLELTFSRRIANADTTEIKLLDSLKNKIDP
ncbi:MAG: Ig-like domain-containing protein, partial [Ferruginibacter sp.]